MGYRSDVALALTKAGVETLNRKLDEDALNRVKKQHVKELISHAQKHFIDESGDESWYWEQIKWYTDWKDDYPEIHFIDSLLRELNEDEFYFIRIGEDYDDVEIRGLWLDNPFEITLCREIIFDNEILSSDNSQK